MYNLRRNLVALIFCLKLGLRPITWQCPGRRRDTSQQLCWMFGCLKLNPKRKLAFNFQHPMISEKCSKNTIGMISIETPQKQYQATCQLQGVSQCWHIALLMKTTTVIRRPEGRRPESCSSSVTKRQWFGTENVRTPSRRAPLGASFRRWKMRLSGRSPFVTDSACLSSLLTTLPTSFATTTRQCINIQHWRSRR